MQTRHTLGPARWREYSKPSSEFQIQTNFQPIRNIGKLYSTVEDPDDEYLIGLRRSTAKHNSLIIRRSGRLFGGLVDDVK
jgi:hypothetical protein